MFTMFRELIESKRVGGRRCFCFLGFASFLLAFQVQVIDDVDQNIFRPVRWDDDIQNFGLSVMNVSSQLCV